MKKISALTLSVLLIFTVLASSASAATRLWSFNTTIGAKESIDSGYISIDSSTVKTYITQMNYPNGPGLVPIVEFKLYKKGLFFDTLVDSFSLNQELNHGTLIKTLKTDGSGKYKFVVTNGNPANKTFAINGYLQTGD
ncbi:hypothetical protein DCC85_03985 [Paenibacillus sp. CAA11]|uniref:hypothetical protein n=1 Tax=Paenibacillus sp. CAA11 TaxID=1532905 RepID=UPI000D3769F5|nr:hypothetical protein [Paenibacillus sp. CAA11]AWB43464.1 hypothetical protein DCC85_03985 [Paenibacillus sp. CAA11]